MTDAVLTVDLTAPTTEILRLFSGYPVHHLPVVKGTKVVGMLGASDLLKLKGFLPRLGSRSLDYLNEHMRIAEVMRQPAITIRPHQSIEKAATLMAEHGIHSLPVTDDDEHLLGIITTTDIISNALHFGRSEGPARSSNGLGRGERAVEFTMSQKEVDEALHLATADMSSENDRGKLARALLYAKSQLSMLENVLVCAQRYVHAGQDEHLHTLLIKAIHKAQEPSHSTAGGLSL
jgi:CBS domain-containing protein